MKKKRIDYKKSHKKSIKNRTQKENCSKCNKSYDTKLLCNFCGSCDKCCVCWNKNK